MKSFGKNAAPSLKGERRNRRLALCSGHFLNLKMLFKRRQWPSSNSLVVQGQVKKFPNQTLAAAQRAGDWCYFR
jgi:hypothetical protein